MNLLMFAKAAISSNGPMAGGFGHSCAPYLLVLGGLSLAIAGYLVLKASPSERTRFIL